MFFIIVLLCSFVNVCAQDLIVLNSGEEKVVKIVEVNDKQVACKEIDKPEGITFYIDRSDIQRIVFDDGTVENLTKNAADNVSDNNSLSGGISMYEKGRIDAATFYDHDGGKTGTLVVSLLSPLVGLVPAVACSSTTPKEPNLGYPSQELMSNFDYRSGYTSKARKIKSKKVWTAWGIGLGVNFAVAILLLN
ncbi:MAG: hypothetical protein R2798_01875 [Chitinophagales bacterium]|nr:hypothetical protein [Bacteroidota bacterium]